MGWIQNNEHVHQLQAGHEKIKAHLDNVFIIFPQIFQQACAEFQSWFQTVCYFNNFLFINSVWNPIIYFNGKDSKFDINKL